MSKLQDIEVGSFIKVNDFKALGIKALLFANSPLKEKYEVYSVYVGDGEDDVGAISVILETLEDGNHSCGIIFEHDLHAIELIKKGE